MTSPLDPEAQADPDGVYLDLWIIDVGPPAIAEAVLSQGSLRELRGFMEISTTDEPILVVETARHGLVTDDFVRNTSPDLLSAEQAGFPVALRDADIYVQMNDAVPDAVKLPSGCTSPVTDTGRPKLVSGASSTPKSPERVIVCGPASSPPAPP